MRTDEKENESRPSRSAEEGRASALCPPRGRFGGFASVDPAGRQRWARTLATKYPDRVPVLIDYPRGGAALLRLQKYFVPAGMSLSELTLHLDRADPVPRRPVRFHVETGDGRPGVFPLLNDRRVDSLRRSEDGFVYLLIDYAPDA